MKNVYESVASCVGTTPAIRLHRITGEFKAHVYAKLDFMNPSGSVKDRLAESLIDEAEKNGRIRPGGTIIDVTSGNMGVGLAMVAAHRGYRTVFVIPDKQSEEKRAVLRAYGARVVVVPSNVDQGDTRSADSTARRLAEETPNSFFIDQYHTPLNPDLHHAHTGPEIWEQFDGHIDVFICGMGTGGTITGVGRYLKEQNPRVRVIGVDPVGSVLYDYYHTGQTTAAHDYMVEGIGANFLPGALDFQYVDDVFRVNDKESFQITRRLVREEGVFAGGSSGAALAGAIKFLKLHDAEGLQVVVLLPDAGASYLSKIFNDNWMRENGFLDPDSGLGTVREVLKDLGPQQLVTVPATARVPEVIGVLKLYGISQVPVVENDRLIGIVSERRLLERAMRGGAPDTQARHLVEADYCTVDPDTEISVVLDLFRRARVAIVLDGNRPTNILARIDIIDYISRATALPREG